MTDDDKPVEIFTRPAPEFGWVRIPERDLPSAWAWELPSGVRAYFPTGLIPIVARIKSHRGD